MELSSTTAFSYVSSVTHDGKVVLVATAADGGLWYTVKQDGFEDSYLNADPEHRTGWESWNQVPLPGRREDPLGRWTDEEPDRSVIVAEVKANASPKRDYVVDEEIDIDPDATEDLLLRSRYKTYDISAPFAARLVSALGHLYVFRQSEDGALLCDRFVLDGMTNKMVRKLEVRFKRSRQRYTPLQSGGGAAGKLTTVDALDFRDANSQPFFEPTIEFRLGSTTELEHGWFDVVVVPTDDHDVFCWHFVTWDTSELQLVITSIRSSAEGQFNLTDTVSGATATLSPAIVIQRLDLETHAVSAEAEGPLAATTYDVQQERIGDDGQPHLLRLATRLMVTVPTDEGLATLRFAIAADGSLSVPKGEPELEHRRQTRTELMLPIDTLERVRGSGTERSAHGQIETIGRDSKDRLVLTSADGEGIEGMRRGDIVEIRKAPALDGHYDSIADVQGADFYIAPKHDGATLGNWTKVIANPTGLISDGLVSALTLDGDEILVEAPGHGLSDGDTALISSMPDLNRQFRVAGVEDGRLTLEPAVEAGIVVNATRAAKRRRAIELPPSSTISASNIAAGAALAACQTYSLWVSPDSADGADGARVVVADDVVQVAVVDGQVELATADQDGGNGWNVRLRSEISAGEWTHLAVVVERVEVDGDKLTRLTLMLDEVATTEEMDGWLAFDPATIGRDGRRTASLRLGRPHDGGPEMGIRVADLRLWAVARSTTDISGSMYASPTGSESGLIGYWRLGAIVPGEPRTAVDFSVHANDAVIDGDAFVAATEPLDRHVGPDEEEATQYINDDLVAVSQHALYEESFEFRLDDGDGYPDDTDHADDPAQTLFRFAIFGRSSRGATDKHAITPISQQIEPAESNGWYRATCQFTVPETVSLVRSFGIDHVTGSWDQLWIRRHRMVCISDATSALTTRGTADLATASRADASPGLIHEIAELDVERSLHTRQKRHYEMLLDRAEHLEDLIAAKVQQIEEQQSYLPSQQAMVAFWTEEVAASKLKARLFYDEDYDGGDYNVGIGNYSFAGSGWNNILTSVLVPTGLKVTLYALYDQNPASGSVELTADDANVGHSHSFNDATSSVRVETLIGGSTDATYVANQLALFKKNVASIGTTITRLLNELQELKTSRKLTPDELRARIDEATERRDEATEALHQKSDEVLEVVRATQGGSFGLQPIDGSPKALKTLGAIYPFVRPSSRIALAESCQGTVRASYFAHDRRLETVVFDTQTETWSMPSGRSSVEFRTNDGSVLAEGGSPLRLGNKWTVEAWLRFPLGVNDQGGDHPVHVRALIASADGQDVYLGSQYDPKTDTELLGTRVGGAFASSGITTQNISDGWHHVAVVGADETASFYLDGQPALSDEVAHAVAKKPSQAITRLGGAPGCTAIGGVTEVRVWNLALPEAELSVNAQTSLTGHEPGLVMYLPMSEAGGDVVRDHTGSGRDFSVGASQWLACSAPIGRFAGATGTPGPVVVMSPWFGEGSRLVISGALPFESMSDDSDVNEWGEEIDALNYWRDRSYTAEVWVKPSVATPSTGVVLDLGGLQLRYRMVGQNLALQVDGVELGLTLAADRWNHLACVVNDNLRYAYDSEGDETSVRGSTELTVVVDGVHRTYSNDDLHRVLEDFESAEEAPPESETWLALGCHRLSLADPYDELGEHLIAAEFTELRIWDSARSVAEIEELRWTRLQSPVVGLAARWALADIPDNGSSPDTTSTGSWAILRLSKVATAQRSDCPVAISDLAEFEYSTLTTNPQNGTKQAMMRRGYAAPSSTGLTVLPDQRIEELDLVWVGNSQFAPTLLGYIEGAPPIPTENLTFEEDYGGATSVALKSSDDVEFSWERSDNSGGGAHIEAFAGTAGETEAGGLVASERVEEHKAGIAGDSDIGYQMVNSSSVSSQSAIEMSDSLALTGSPETEAKFPSLGKRFVPKNVGYALVVSALADVFITRLRRSKRMISYQVVPVADVPPDTNTITFLLNPAYTMAGSLDGLTGTSATSDRFFRHVPEMRAQYGSKYPASFYRLDEAYDLKRQIEAQDKARAAYFASFNSRLVDTASLNREVESGAAPAAIGVTLAVDKPADGDAPKSDADKRAAESKRIAEIEAAGKENAKRHAEVAKQKQAQIQERIDDQDKRTHAQASLQAWQKKMESIQTRAGKHNIVNNYVWDADGGMRTEAQSFSNTIEHTIGGEFEMSAALGAHEEVEAALAGELTAQVTAALTQTMAKTERHSTGFSLEVDLDGVESRGITNHDDYPLLPGEKVDRYRFMSFYLEGSTRNFRDFFDYVVDPEWLASNDEEARALRQAQGKANKAWRVLHRVTYVERPALMGFGRDVRALQKIAPPTIEERLVELQKQIATLTQTINDAVGD